MDASNLAQYALFLLLVLVCVKPLGIYLCRVFARERTFLDPALVPVERWIYRVARVNPESEMDWKTYALAFVAFGALGTLLLFLVLLLQPLLPWYSPAHLTTPMTVDLALNTSVSFATVTTWQAYGGEATMSYASQMLGLASQNFLAGAAGLSVGIAFIRGIARERAPGLGNFWVDLTRSLLWVLLPLALVLSLALVWQGVPMNFNSYATISTLQGEAQTIAQGPVAALETIKNLGTNGGGFFNVNGAHPYENPTALTNLLEMLMIAALPAALTYTFGRMIRAPGHGWLIFWVMTGLFAVGLLVAAWAEQSGNPLLARLCAEPRGCAADPAGNMEGKETRFGVHGSVLAAVTTSNGSTGSYNSMHDSYTPIGGMVPLVNMLLGEILYGGLGAGIYSMVMLVLISVFVGGLMVGHAPHYFGKRLTLAETRLIGLYTVIGTTTVLILTAAAVLARGGRSGLVTNQGAHGLSEILYAYSSSFGNNGQTFAGLDANNVFYNLSTALAMLIGRFVLGALALALAGSFVAQGRKPASIGTISADTPTFAVLLVATIVILAGLSYLPVLALGPIIEHLIMG